MSEGNKTNTIEENMNGYTIKQRKPDVEQDESIYETTISDSYGLPVAIGHGFNQGMADTDCLNKFINLINEEKE